MYPNDINRRLKQYWVSKMSQNYSRIQTFTPELPLRLTHIAYYFDLFLLRMIQDSWPWRVNGFIPKAYVVLHKFKNKATSNGRWNKFTGKIRRSVYLQNDRYGSSRNCIISQFNTPIWDSWTKIAVARTEVNQRLFCPERNDENQNMAYFVMRIFGKSKLFPCITFVWRAKGMPE